MSFSLWVFEVEFRWPRLKVRRHRHREHRRAVKLTVMGEQGGGTIHVTFRRHGHGHKEAHQHG